MNAPKKTGTVLFSKKITFVFAILAAISTKLQKRSRNFTDVIDPENAAKCRRLEENRGMFDKNYIFELGVSLNLIRQINKIRPNSELDQT